jgi:hypothetical protein
MVDTIAVPAGRTADAHLFVTANPLFGAVSITDPAAVQPDGDTWTRTASGKADGVPARADRQKVPAHIR